jgi:hypothetical protein
MAIRRRVAGYTAAEASLPAEPPDPHPPAGGGGRTAYPEYDVMAPDKWRHDWDAKTRQMVLDRLHYVPTRSFFSAEAFATLVAVCQRLLPQDDRPAELRIPIAPLIDEGLAHGDGDGYRYEDMPWDDAAYHLGLAGIGQTSRALFGEVAFTDLETHAQDEVLAAIEDGDPPGDVWRELPARRFFRRLVQDVIAAYYAHPAAWNEIGFQGPASPRGHIRLALGQRDPWEAEETAPLPPEARASAARQPGSTVAGQGGATH